MHDIISVVLAKLFRETVALFLSAKNAPFLQIITKIFEHWYKHKKHKQFFKKFSCVKPGTFILLVYMSLVKQHNKSYVLYNIVLQVYKKANWCKSIQKSKIYWYTKYLFFILTQRKIQIATGITSLKSTKIHTSVQQM